jgi:hypothetical protein
LAAPGGLLPLVGHVPDRHRRHAELLGDHPNAAGPAGTALRTRSGRIAQKYKEIGINGREMHRYEKGCGSEATSC